MRVGVALQGRTRLFGDSQDATQDCALRTVIECASAQ